MATLTMRGVDLPSGEVVPVLGQGTWHLGQRRHPRAEEIAAIREGIGLGMTLVDTAEMWRRCSTLRLASPTVCVHTRIAFPTAGGGVEFVIDGEMPAAVGLDAVSLDEGVLLRCRGLVVLAPGISGRHPDRARNR